MRHRTTVLVLCAAALCATAARTQADDPLGRSREEVEAELAAARRPIPLRTAFDTSDPKMLAKMYRERLDQILLDAEHFHRKPGLADNIRNSTHYAYTPASTLSLNDYDSADDLLTFEAPDPGNTWPSRARRLRIAWSGSVATLTATQYCADGEQRCQVWFKQAVGMAGKITTRHFGAISVQERISRFDLSKPCSTADTYMPRPAPHLFAPAQGEDSTALTAMLVDRCRNTHGVWLLKSSGDLAYDRTIVRTLSKWQLSPERYRPNKEDWPGMLGRVPIVAR